MDTFLHRLINALRLDLTFYTEAAHTPSLNGESFFMMIGSVFLSSFLILAAGERKTEDLFIALGLSMVLLAVFVAQVGLICWVGRLFFHSPASYIEVQRALSYPFFLGNVLIWLPCVGLISGFWSIAAYYVAARGALQTGRGSAIGVLFLSYMFSYGLLFVMVSSLVNVPVFFQWLLNKAFF